MYHCLANFPPLTAYCIYFLMSSAHVETSYMLVIGHPDYHVMFHSRGTAHIAVDCYSQAVSMRRDQLMGYTANIAHDVQVRCRTYRAHLPCEGLWYRIPSNINGLCAVHGDIMTCT